MGQLAAAYRYGGNGPAPRPGTAASAASSGGTGAGGAGGRGYAPLTPAGSTGAGSTASRGGFGSPLVSSIARGIGDWGSGLVNNAMTGGYSTADAIERHNSYAYDQRASDYQAQLDAERARLAAAYGPQFLDAMFQKSDAQRGLMYQPLLDANSTDALNIAYRANMANLGLDRQSNGIDQAGTLRDIGYYNDVYNLDARGALAGMQDQQMAQKSREQQMREQLALGGAGWTQGLRSDKEQSDYQYDSGIRGINLDLERSGLTRDQQVAQANDRLAQLKIQAERFNVTETQLAAELQNQIDRIGLNGQISVGQLLDRSSQADANVAMLQQQLIQQAIANLNQRGTTAPSKSPQRPTKAVK